jgi:transketolase
VEIRGNPPILEGIRTLPQTYLARSAAAPARSIEMSTDLRKLAVNTIRALAIDAVQAANSGHPGAPLGLAPAAYALFADHLRFNPNDPTWPNRDRFVLSNGHASALLYSVLHLTGYDLPLDQLKQFRQLGSKTPGHPEYRVTPGVEVTTGPLGQGFTNGVGMAIAEALLASKFNRPGHAIIDHLTFGICSDGDLQEGISYEAASLAGHLGLGKLIFLYDDNKIQIDGSTDSNFTEDVPARFRAQHWHVVDAVDGNDPAAITAAIAAAKGVTDQPSLIVLKTVIGFGSPLAGSEKTHGAPLGVENVAKTKEALGFPTEPLFHVPAEVRAHFAPLGPRGDSLQKAWDDQLAVYRRAHPELAARLECALAGELPEGWAEPLDNLFSGADKPAATRSSSGKIINALAAKIETLLGGSADLAGSNNTLIAGEGPLAKQTPGNRNIFYGVREHAMGAIANGLALHGGLIPYVATFFTFTDYMRTPVRLASLMGLRVIYVLTHDSIGVGEDGPTHQPIEHLNAMRGVPGLHVLRPADACETREAWKSALQRTNGPTALILTRQNLPALDQTAFHPADGLHRGGYVLWDSTDQTPEVILIGTGSETHLAVEAGRLLAAEGVSVRIVSLPSWEIFDAQPAAYRESVLPQAVRARVSVEAGRTRGWEHYVGQDGIAIGIDTFGASAPASELFPHFGVTVDAVVAAARRLLSR